MERPVIEAETRILVAIPVHNERKHVMAVMDRVRAIHPNLLVVDDGSTDGTGELLDELRGVTVLHHSLKRGYGQSLIDAFSCADSMGYDWVITMDCDEQHEPETIPRFRDAIATDQWDIISGSRYMDHRSDDDLPPLDRRTINETLTTALNDLFPSLAITDAFCGFKAHRMSAMARLNLNVPGYAFPLQLWPQVANANLRVTEIPVRLIYNDPTRQFGGSLDDAEKRMRHYLAVLHEELERLHDPVKLTRLQHVLIDTAQQ
jgi:glycosyltransferase involved in cell wall biosynthesis